MDLLTIYNKVDALLDTLDFNTIFTGFHKYKYALYNSREICLDGDIMPYQNEFRGNTSLKYNGEYIAIWNMECDPVGDEEMLAYLVVHEMFHCHQRTNGEKRYPSDFVLLNYPDDRDNFEKKYNENLFLASAYEKCDFGLLQKFAFIRDKRMKVYPDMVLQELEAETLEGMAEYAGLKALKNINPGKFEEVTSSYVHKLRAEDDLLFDVRRISYYSGSLYFLCLDKLGIVMKNDFASGQTIYEQNPIAFDGITASIKHYSFIASRYARLVKEKENIIAEYIEKAEYTACNAFICGYDPMNMFRARDLVYCRHFVCLNTGGTVKNINSAVVLKLAGNSGQNVDGYYMAEEI